MLRAQRVLLTVIALVECLTGLAIFAVPSTAIAVLLGAAPNDAGAMVGQLAGVALFAVGMASWGARTDPGGSAGRGVVVAVTLYNVGAGLLLIAFAVAGRASGVIVWIAGLGHIVLAAALLATQVRRTVPSATTPVA